MTKQQLVLVTGGSGFLGAHCIVRLLSAGYPRSKTVAERAAWDFSAREGEATELSVVNPTAIFGPALGPDLSTSLLLIRSLLSGGRVTAGFGVVDVRDAAELHLLAMTSPQAAGKRFIGIAGEFVTAADIARALKKGLGAAADLVPDPAALPGAGTAEKSASNAQACRLLGWRPRSNEEAIVAAGESIVRLGLAAPAARQAPLPPDA